MLFKARSTFNTHDSKRVRNSDGRNEIQHGVEKRCDAIVTLFGKYRRAKSIKEVTVVLRALELESGGKESYTRSDVEYALLRLADADVLVRTNGKYSLAVDGKTTWKKMERVTR